MSATYTKVPTRFGPETRFEVQPTPAVPYRALQQSRFEQLKARLLARHLAEVWEPALNSQVRRAANEAAALAWVTPYPLLFFPVLFEEKVQLALEFSERQEQVRRQSRDWLAL